MKNNGGGADLTPKQRLFLKNYLDPNSPTFGNGVRTALKVYDTDDYWTAGSIAYENLKKLQTPVRVLMEQRGIGVDRLLSILDEGMGANRTISAISGKQTTGTDTDFIEVPDYATRHKYLETAGKWLGMEEEKGKTIGVRTDGESIEVIIKDYE